MNYPLSVNFKKIALANQFSIIDANNNMVCYVKQKMFKLKEEIKVFQEREQVNLIYTIKADRIIDFSAKYTFYDRNNKPIGAVKRKGGRSLWRAHYVIEGNANEELTITEDSVFIRFLDNLVGFITGLFLNPSYTVKKGGTTPLVRVKKLPALMEGKFKIEMLGQMDQAEETRVLLGCMMMLLLERIRG